MMRSCLRPWLFLAALLPVQDAGAALLSRTITIDGTMTDWYAAPDITGNPGQFSTDCQQGDACELDSISSTGRDLRKFSFTWDDSYLYFYVERYASASNTTTWLFYLDENANGFMEAGERIFRVDWQGSNRSTDAYLCPYSPVNAATGDPIANGSAGDGNTMPGGSSNGGCTQLYRKVTGGSGSGLEMESRVSWAQLGLSGPQNIRFHISSSNGMNLPGQIIDNMAGPGGGGGDEGGGGGQLFPPDIAVAIDADVPEVHVHQTVTFTVTAANPMFDDFSAVAIDVSLPPQFRYLSHAVPAGTDLVDTDADIVPDRWLIPLLAAGDTLSLTLQARALPVSLPLNVTTSATLNAWATADDSDPGNNLADAVVQLLPVPEIAVTRVASATSVDPGATVRLTSTVTNNAAAAIARNIQLTEKLGEHLSLRLDTFGPGLPLEFSDGTVPSGLNGILTVEFSADGGTDWSYVPQSGGGGAPTGHDRNVTHFRATMDGTMHAGGSFSLRYEVRVE